MRKFSWMVPAVALLIAFAAPAVADDPVCLDAEVLAAGPMSGFDPSPFCDAGTCPGRDLAISNADLFAKIWQQVSTDPVPAINFRQQLVIATFMGKRPNTSYSTSIDCVRRSLLVGIGSVPLVADITDSNAGAGCIVSPAVVNPFEIVVVDRPTNGFGMPTRVTVSFDHTTSVTTCDPDDPICRVCPPGGGGNQDLMGGGLPCCP